MIESSDQIRRTVEAYTIGKVEALRVGLEFFIEDIQSLPSKTFPERFGGILIDAENLLKDIRTILNRPHSENVTSPDEMVTDEMVEAAKQAMSWEGSVIPEEEQDSIMRDVLTNALIEKKNPTILL